MKRTHNDTHDSGLKTQLERVGAGLLAGMAMLVSVELVMEHAPSGEKRSGHGSSHGYNTMSEIFARGEGKGETARLPEEFDIGLQTPKIAGL